MLTVFGIAVIAAMPVLLLWNTDVVGNWPVMSAVSFLLGIFLLIGFVRTCPRPRFALKMSLGFLLSLLPVYAYEQTSDTGWLFNVLSFFFAAFYALPGIAACIIAALYLYKGRRLRRRKTK